MCNAGCVIFGVRNIAPEEILKKRVLEVGSRDVNGSLRSILESMAPSEYVGADIESGPGVDVLCGSEDLVEKFGEESFDAVISTEMLEHVRDWRAAISNMKRVCRRGGFILLTTRSVGFAYHSFPHDFWRFNPEDMSAIFSDFIIEEIHKDTSEPGVFLKARKPERFRENILSGYEVYSVIGCRPMLDIGDEAVEAFRKKYVRLRKLKELVKRVRDAVFRCVMRGGS